MAGIVLDSSVVIALLTPFDKHHEAAIQLIARCTEKLMISTLTLTEVLVKPARVSDEACREMVQDMSAHFGDPIDLSSQIAITAAIVRARTGLATPDAIISASATVSGATLWTCDATLAKAHKGARLLA